MLIEGERTGVTIRDGEDEAERVGEALNDSILSGIELCNRDAERCLRHTS